MTVLRKIVWVVAIVLFAKTLGQLVYEYRWYFPADFDSAFLSGKRHSFWGVYSFAFYSHIVAGPIAVVLGALLMGSGPRWRRMRWHRYAGRWQAVLVLAVLAPSGLYMAQSAYAGAFAAWGFSSLAIATAATVALAVMNARAGRMAAHQQWATRCFILLCSPLLLRLISGALIATEMESNLTYQLNAWLSWLGPLAVYEVWRLRSLVGVAASQWHPGRAEEASL